MSPLVAGVIGAAAALGGVWLGGAVTPDHDGGLDQDCWGVPCLTRLEGLNDHWVRQTELLREQLERERAR